MGNAHPEKEALYFKKAKQLAPPWFCRFAMLANLTALDLSSITGLTESMVKWDADAIVVVRAKTHEQHHAPLTPEAAAVIREQVAAERRKKVRRLDDPLAFTRDDSDAPVSNAMVNHWHRVTRRAARLTNWWFRDWRHQAASRWADDKGLATHTFTMVQGHGLESVKRHDGRLHQLKKRHGGPGFQIVPC
jgi:integrase